MIHPTSQQFLSRAIVSAAEIWGIDSLMLARRQTEVACEARIALVVVAYEWGCIWREIERALPVKRITHPAAARQHEARLREDRYRRNYQALASHAERIVAGTIS